MFLRQIILFFKLSSLLHLILFQIILVSLSQSHMTMTHESTPESLFNSNNLSDWFQPLAEMIDSEDSETEMSNYALEPTVKMVLLMDKTMAILKFDNSEKNTLEECMLYDLEKPSDRVKSAAASIGMPIVKCDFKTMQNAINRCRELTARLDPVGEPSQNQTSLTGIANLSEGSSAKPTVSLWRGLIPGTKWCGLGDSAGSYEDLGPRRDIDLCCRAHDHCPIRLKAFRYEYGLINLSLYTKSHCECDQDFLKCLKGANSTIATILGNFYFNVLKVQCIKEEKPLVCVEVRKNKNGFEECVRYETSGETRMKFVAPELEF